MKVRMLEHFQGTNLPTLVEGKEYDVDLDLASYLLEHRKAVRVEQPKHYGSQPLEEGKAPELRHDDELAEEVKVVVDPAPVGEEISAVEDEGDGETGILPELTEENKAEPKTASLKKPKSGSKKVGKK